MTTPTEIYAGGNKAETGLTLEDLWRRARGHERRMLCHLAKCYYLAGEEWDIAIKWREREQRLADDIEEAVKNLGEDLLHA